VCVRVCVCVCRLKVCCGMGGRVGCGMGGWVGFGMGGLQKLITVLGRFDSYKGGV
jgi:hypothetical protein